MRIAVDPGGLGATGFAPAGQEIASIANGVAVALSGVGSAAGSGSLASAVSDLQDALTAADTSAGLSVSSLAKAVANAAAGYRATEEAITRAEVPR